MVPKLSKVLVTTDFSDVANKAVPYAYGVAGQGGEVHLLHVIEHQDVPSPLHAHYSPDELNRPEKRKEVTEKVTQELQALIPQGAQEKGVATQTAVGCHPHVARGIIKEAEQRGADCIVVGSHGRGALLHLLLGSVAEEVLRGAAVPVLIVPDRG
jgi:nucleotide-binding universal stress UspA family protein